MLKPSKNTVSFRFGDQTYTWGDCNNWVLFAGPDLAEDEGLVLETAQELKKITAENNVPWILKCSFDKANRTSGKSFRGQGVEGGLKILQTVKEKVGCPVITDIHDVSQVPQVAEVADVIQIPAFLCRQTDLLHAVADTQKVMHVKKGQFLAPWDMANVATKIASTGCENIMLAERGASFGYNTLVTDFTKATRQMTVIK